MAFRLPETDYGGIGRVLLSNSFFFANRCVEVNFRFLLQIGWREINVLLAKLVVWFVALANASTLAMPTNRLESQPAVASALAILPCGTLIRNPSQSRLQLFVMTFFAFWPYRH
jgi:hypothetical protein